MGKTLVNWGMGELPDDFCDRSYSTDSSDDPLNYIHGVQVFPVPRNKEPKGNIRPWLAMTVQAFEDKKKSLEPEWFSHMKLNYKEHKYVWDRLDSQARDNVPEAWPEWTIPMEHKKQTMGKKHKPKKRASRTKGPIDAFVTKPAPPVAKKTKKKKETPRWKGCLDVYKQLGDWPEKHYDGFSTGP